MNPVMWFTKRLRTFHASKFVNDHKGLSLLDIGCGDGHFIGYFSDISCLGIDKRTGDDIDNPAIRDLITDKFDYISMLAVLEHLKNPFEVITWCRGRLKPGGIIIITTPFEEAETFIGMYASLDCHERYFKLNDFMDYGLVHYRTFALGLNQLIILR